MHNSLTVSKRLGVGGVESKRFVARTTTDKPSHYDLTVDNESSFFVITNFVVPFR
jgi:hypothetical protein